jgi:hypothetical protein
MSPTGSTPRRCRYSARVDDATAWSLDETKTGVGPRIGGNESGVRLP